MTEFYTSKMDTTIYKNFKPNLSPKPKFIRKDKVQFVRSKTTLNSDKNSISNVKDAKNLRSKLTLNFEKKHEIKLEKSFSNDNFYDKLHSSGKCESENYFGRGIIDFYDRLGVRVGIC